MATAAREAPPGRTVWLTPHAVALLAAAALAAAVTVERALDMASMSMPGTMGLGLPAWVLMWTLMMAAMMLPSAAPFASMYSRTMQERRGERLALFVSGYLFVWGLSGVPAFGLAWLAGNVTGQTAGIILAAGIFTVCGVYQLTPLKERCLTHCRSPIAHLFQYASYTGRLRDLRVGLEHGWFCLACCWGLMLLMMAFGAMNVLAMVALAAVIAVEKLWGWGHLAAKATGAAALAAAVAVFWVPGIAPGLTGEPMSMDGGSMAGMDAAAPGMSGSGSMAGDSTSAD